MLLTIIVFILYYYDKKYKTTLKSKKTNNSQNKHRQKRIHTTESESLKSFDEQHLIKNIINNDSDIDTEKSNLSINSMESFVAPTAST